MSALTQKLAFLATLSVVSVLHADTAPSPNASNASVDEMRAAIQKSRTSNFEAERDVKAAKQVANRQQDVIKLNCVNNKYVELKAHMDLADGQVVQLDHAIHDNSDERFKFFAELESTSAAIRSLRAEALACVGENEISNDSGVTVTHPDLPDDPIADNPFDERNDENAHQIEPPAYASPYN